MHSLNSFAPDELTPNELADQQHRAAIARHYEGVIEEWHGGGLHKCSLCERKPKNKMGEVMAKVKFFEARDAARNYCNFDAHHWQGQAVELGITAQDERDWRELCQQDAAQTARSF